MEAVDQLVQIAGAIAILTAFVLVQAGRMDPASIPYLVLNLVGSFVLAVDAAIGREWGFLLLEGVWAMVSAWSLIRVLRGGRPAGTSTTH